MRTTTLAAMLAGQIPAPIPAGVARMHRMSDKTPRPDLDRLLVPTVGRSERLKAVVALAAEAGTTGITAIDISTRLGVPGYIARDDASMLARAGKLDRIPGSGARPAVYLARAK